MMDGRAEPDQQARAYLKAIAGDQEAVARATPPANCTKKIDQSYRFKGAAAVLALVRF
jgi:hypothetical protein